VVSVVESVKELIQRVESYGINKVKFPVERIVVYIVVVFRRKPS
jgi:hypothetical protein